MKTIRVLLAGLAIALCGATTVPARRPARELPAPEDDVRAVLDRWQRTQTVDSLAAHRTLYADSIVEWGRKVDRTTYVDWIGRQSRGGARSPAIDVSRATVRIDGATATAEPVLVLRTSDLEVTRLLLRKERGRWVVFAREITAEQPIEMAYPELGAPYVARIDAWAGDVLAWVRGQLHANPPQTGDIRRRMQALHTLDEPLHLRSSHMLPAVRRFLRKGAYEAIAGIRTERVTEGATIWQLYNQGWIVKTASHRWAFDFYDGPDSIAMSDAQIDALVEGLDALFISHRHSDHMADRVIERAVAKGVPVLLPPVSAGERGDATRADMRRFGGGATAIEPNASGEVGGLRYRAYPGHQDGLPNNCYAVTADGMTILHTGDQRWEPDSTWIARVGDEIAVDVLLPAIWTMESPYFVRGIRPRWIIPGHLVELGHGFDGRFPYDRAYDLVLPLDGIDWRVLAWGEKVHVPAR